MGEWPYAVGGSRSVAHGLRARRSEVAGFAVGAVAILGLGAAHGGYFPSAWGWAVVAFVIAFAWALATGVAPWRTRSEAVFLCALLAFACWCAISGVWGIPSTAIDEAVRALVYVSGAALALVVVRRATVPALLAGVLAAVAGLSSYALASRLFPDRIGAVDSIAGYRLATPIGYWNALGLICAIAALIGLGLATSTVSPARAALAAAPLPILVATLYFTFSRAAWIALGIGLVVSIGLDPRRVRLTATTLAAGVPAGAGVWAASRSAPLTHLQSTVARAAHDGHRLALLVAALVVAAATLTAALAYVRRRSVVPAVVERVYALALAAAVVVAIVVVLVAAGGPSAAARRAWGSFAGPPPNLALDLNKRLFGFSGNGRAGLYRAAWSDARAHLVVGSGAGSYEAYWLQHRGTPSKVRNAHNLYLETLATVGVVGLAMLLCALGAPLVAAMRVRRRPGVAAATGAFVAYLAGVAVDWDWQITSVTLAAAFVGVALLASARDEDGEAAPAMHYRLLGVALAVGLVGFVFLVGNMFLSRSAAAASNGNWTASAHDARRASSWLPWSSQPYRQLGEAQLAEGDPALAQQSFRKAIHEDGSDWSLWLDLARASSGHEQRAALARASELNPLSPEVAAFRTELGAQSGISIVAGKQTP